MKKQRNPFMVKQYFTPILLLAVILFSGCSKFNYDETNDLFFIRNNGADMPVWVRGNTASGVFVIFNHGGPGSSGLLEAHMEAQPANGNLDHESPLKILEESYAMVYWDQRHSGNAQGNANPDETTIEDFGDDMELLINALNKRHNVSKLIVIGQSWGHTVATIYFTYGSNWQQRQTKVDGYINYKGNISYNMAYQYAKPRMIAYADQMINEAVEIDYWNDAKNFLNDNDRIESKDNAMKYFEFTDKAMDAEISSGQRISTSVNYSFFSPHNGWYHWANNNSTNSSQFLENLIEDDRLIETTPSIQIPTLLIYGRHDLIAPFEVGEWHLENINTPTIDKELLILENSGHGAEGDDIHVFQDAVIDFINSL